MIAKLDMSQTTSPTESETGSGTHRLLVTREFALERDVYFGILGRQHLWRNGWAYVGMLGLVVAAVILSLPRLPTAVLAALAVATPLYNMWRLRRHAYAAENAPLFRRRVLRITSSIIHGESDDGTSGEVAVRDVHRVVRGPAHYLVYATRTAFLYIPFEAFETPTDRAAFEQLFADVMVPPRPSRSAPTS